MRLDVLLVERGLAESRTKAAAMIKSGCVTVNGLTVTRSSFDADKEADVSIAGEAVRYVGRGGDKLAAALGFFGVKFNGLIGADLGASTGGFTDCAIQNGAAKVYAADVGTGQLHPRLTADGRVVSLENTDARNLILPEKCDFVLVDVSFISLTKILPAITRLLGAAGFALVLVKPQFEALEHHRHKNGVIKSEKARKDAISRVISAAEECGLHTAGMFECPLRGGKGNQEYFLLLKSYPLLKHV